MTKPVMRKTAFGVLIASISIEGLFLMFTVACPVICTWEVVSVARRVS
jgi:hypothetical protein